MSFIQRFHSTTKDSRPDPNVSFIQRFHCTTKDSRPDPNVSFIQRFHSTTRDSRPDPNVSFIQRFHSTTRDSRPDPNVSFIRRFHWEGVVVMVLTVWSSTDDIISVCIYIPHHLLQPMETDEAVLSYRLRSSKLVGGAILPELDIFSLASVATVTRYQPPGKGRTTNLLSDQKSSFRSSTCVLSSTLFL